MYNNQKLLFLFFVAFLITTTTTNTKAQLLTDSPYSRFGLGELHNSSFGAARAMGGITTAYRASSHLNPSNPASYSGIPRQTFVFDVGLSLKGVQLISNEEKATANSANIQYLSLGFPVTKWWSASAGIMPYSSVGYQIQKKTPTQDANTAIQQLSGEGGINQFYIGSSFELFNRLSLGANLVYLFGSHDKITDLNYAEDDFTYSYKKTSRTLINDLYFNYGLQFTQVFKKKTLLTLGVQFDNQQKIDAKNTILASDVFNYNGNTFYDTLQNVQDDTKYIEIPQNIGIGFTIRHGTKWYFGADYQMQDWTDATFVNEQPSEYTNSDNLSLGLQWIPEAGAPSYFRNVRYRLGFRHSNSYLKINDLQITETALSVGLGMPFKNKRTIVNFFFELGQRGTTQNNLIKENFGIIGINFSFIDTWFIKRKFN